jgi:hypothetical protein
MFLNRLEGFSSILLEKQSKRMVAHAIIVFNINFKNLPRSGKILSEEVCYIILNVLLLEDYIILQNIDYWRQWSVYTYSIDLILL